MMLFDPRLFNAIWLAIACTAVIVGLAIVASIIVSTLTAIQVLRGKTEPKPLIVEAFLRRSPQTRQEPNNGLAPTRNGWPEDF